MRTNTEKSLTIKAILVCSLFIGCLNPFSVAVAQQGVLREVYSDIGGGSLNALTNNPAFPNSPSSVGVLNEFEAPQNVGSNYGQRVRGFIEAPQTGNYIFWVASDDQSQLFLSTNEDPAGKRLIASVSTWTQFRSWEEEPNQRSSPINLQEGELYYIEAIMAEGGGSDHLSVRWQLPDGTIEEPIPGNRLLVELIPPQIAIPPQNVRVTEREPATFEIQMVNQGPVAFQWQRGGEDISGATNRTYTLPSASLSDDGAQFRVTVTNMFGTVTSPSARLRVDPDVEAPFLESVFNPGESNLVTVVFSEPVEEASATDPNNYAIDQGIDVTGASLNPDQETVVLRTTPLTLGTTYRLTVENVRDRAATPNPIATGTRDHFTYGMTPLDAGTVLGKPESVGPSSRRTALIISEIMYHPAAREDDRNLEYIEIHNTSPVIENVGGYRLEGDVNYTFPAGTFVPGKGYLVVAAAPADMKSVYGVSRVIGGFDDNLSNVRGRVRLRNSLDAILLQVDYDTPPPWPVAADGIGHSLVLRRPSFGEQNPKAWGVSELFGGSPGKAETSQANPFRTVVINEFLAHTDDPQLDFVELFNYSTQPVDISGCVLTDDADNFKFVIPDGTVLPALGYQSFDQSELGFALDSSGESIFLVNPQRTRTIDATRFGAQANGVSMGRFPDGAPRFRQLSTPTAGAGNQRPWRPNIVINEIMFHPISENDDDEFLELYNRGDQPVDVGGWELTDGIEFTLPEGTMVEPGGFLVVGRNVDRLSANYPDLDTSTLVGNYNARLANGGERIRLVRPEPNVVTNQNDVVVTNIMQILVDEVDYADGGRWGQWADGDGSSLELIDPESDNDLAANWAGSDETGKSRWTTIEHTGVLDHGNTNFIPDEVQLHLLGDGEALVDDVEVINATNQNVIVNGTFETGTNGWVAQGNHKRSDLEPDEGFESNQSYHVTATKRGDPSVNRIRGLLESEVANGTTATLRLKARWLRGHPEVLLRFYGNYLEAAGAMEVPANLGTPGKPNSRLIENAGPTIHNVQHSPVLPAANQAVTVSAEVSDPDQIGALQLNYRLDPATNFTKVNMTYNGAGFYSATIPGQPADQLVAFHIEASDADGSGSLFPSDAPLRECQVMFGQSQPAGQFGAYRIWVTQKTIDEWSSRARGINEPLDATFVYNQDRVVYNMTAGYSGSPFHWGNYDSPIGNNCNYIAVFPKDDLFLGVTDFVLNMPSNLGSDNTAIREQTFYWMVKQLGQPTTHRRFHHMYVNDVKRGSVYEDAQQPNREYIEEWFPVNPEGELFKIEDWFEFDETGNSFDNVDATLEEFTTTGGELKRARYRWTFRKRSVQESANDYTSLLELVRAVNTPGTKAYTEAVRNQIDVENWMQAIAMRHVVGDWDAFGYRRGKNMYAYKPENGKWHLLHWDVAFAFGLGDGPQHDLFDVSHFDGTIDPVIDRMLKHPPFRRVYWRALKEAVEGPLRASQVNPILDAQHNALISNGIQATSPDLTVKDWIEARRAFISSELAGVAASFTITSNQGENFVTNRNEITLTGTAPVEVKTLRINGVSYPVTWTSVNNWELRYALNEEENQLSVQGFDRFGNLVGNATDSISVTFTGTPEQAEDHLVINEIMYNSVVPGEEFIELHNTSGSTAFNLAGFRIEGVDFTFEEGTVIEPGGFVVVVRDPARFTAAYGGEIPVSGTFAGRLANEGETLVLTRPNTTGGEPFEVDAVAYANERPWPAAANGTGPSLQLKDPNRDNSRVANWAVAGNEATPGAANSVRTDLPAFPPLWVNEVEPNNVNGPTDAAGDHDAWVEIYNSGDSAVSLSGIHLTGDYDNPTQWAFPEGSTIEPGAYRLVWLDAEPGEATANEWHANFSIPADTGSIALVTRMNNQPVVLDFLNYVGMAEDRTYGAFPNGQAIHRQRFQTITPGAGNNPTIGDVTLFINEWLASNTLTLADPADNDFDDWFEIYNPGNAPVDLSGYTLTDDLDDPGQFIIPPGTQIGAGAYMLIWADGEPEQNGPGADLHTDFALNRDGEAIGLYSPAGQPIDTVEFGSQSQDVSQGRIPDGGPAPFVFMDTPTPGEPNQGSTGDGFRITEVSLEATTLTLSWSAKSGQAYRVEYKDELGAAEWTLLEEVTASGDTASVTDEIDAGPQRFYRIVESNGGN